MTPDAALREQFALMIHRHVGWDTMREGSLTGVLDASEAIEARVLALLDRQRELEAVAWQVKDYADGWITYDDKRHAHAVAIKLGARIRPLYAAPPPQPVGEPSGEDVE